MIGGGINFYYSEVNLQSMADMGLAAGLPGMMDVEKVLKGDGTAWGGNIGVIFKINDRNSVAATFKFPFTVDYSGDLGLAGASSPIDASLDFPSVAVLGYAFKPTARCKVELNLDWTNWKAVDDTVITTQFPGLESIVYQWQLKNTMAYKIGTEYAYSDKLALRCGYIYNENATPAETWRPSLPDTDTHFFSAGFGYKLGDLTVDTAFLLIYYAKRDVSNNVDMNEFLSSSSIDGTYRTWAPSLAVSATYKF
jgi:long-chain fatty acid transport protein